jgi:hypothetical protein
MKRNLLSRLFLLTAALLLSGGLTLLRADVSEGATAPPATDHPSQSKATCTPGPNTLCLNGNRFKVSANWRTPAGQAGAARAVSLTPDTGYFWFFQDTNVEFVVKVINGCSLSQRYWVFAGGLTNVQVDIRVEDTRNGRVKTYRNPQNTAFRPIQDTAAFSCRATRGDRALPEQASEDQDLAGAAEQWADFLATSDRLQAASGPALSLRQNRFKVSATWRKPNGQTGTATAVRLTDETGYFWFFDPNNVEMILKILDGCSLSNRFWVFAAGLTNVRVDIRVEDLQTGSVKTYQNPQNTAFRPIQDTSAFACTAGGLPPDPGSAGRQTIAGVDSDRDGIRDDLQRYIHLTYQDSETVSALRQAARTVQTSLTASSPSQSADLATSLLRDMECLYAVRPDDAAEINAAFMASALNTEQRGRAFLTFNGETGGGIYPLKPIQEWNTSCSFPARNIAASRLGLPEEGAEKAICGEGKETTVFFVNGVFTFRSTAYETLLHLALDSASVLPREELEHTQFTLAYNPTLLVLDLWEAVRQRLENDFSRFYRYLAGIENMPDFMAAVLRSEAATVDVVALLNSPTALSHVLTYKREILEGRKVVLVAHSQGNFFANRAYMSLSSEERRSAGIVSVANPDSAVADGRPYTTLTNDLVIAAIPGALPANTTNSANADHDFLHHGLVESYLVAGTASRSRILGHLSNAIDTVESPVAGAGEGVITVTLTWGDQPDVDLHVLEPGGAHVYYANLQGTSGFLDLDDVTGFGPEHYFASCSSLQPGPYQIGVNYYNGFQPETAFIEIQAGLLVRTFVVHLSTARGSSGDSSPVPVATVLVSGNARDGYEFQVQ